MDFSGLLTQGITAGTSLGVAALGGTPAKTAPATTANQTGTTAATSWLTYGLIGGGILLALVMFFALKKK